MISDPEVLAAVDATLAQRAQRWPPMTRSRLFGYADKIVAHADADALRRRREQQADREFSIWDHGNGAAGLCEVFGRLLSSVPRKREVPPAHAVDARLDALAATVCDADPRTHKQRRADAMGALAAWPPAWTGWPAAVAPRIARRPANPLRRRW